MKPNYSDYRPEAAFVGGAYIVLTMLLLAMAWVVEDMGGISGGGFAGGVFLGIVLSFYVWLSIKVCRALRRPKNDPYNNPHCRRP